MFETFFIAGFECATHRRRDGLRVDSIAAQQHDRWAARDYAMLAEHAFGAARDGLRWHLAEPVRGSYDWSSWLPQLRGARDAGVRVIWDLWHYGTPDWLGIFERGFPDRFAEFARAAAEVHRREVDAAPVWCPLNEISFYAFIAGDCGEFHPWARGRGDELKRQLVRAGVAAAHALRTVDPRARIVWCEPAIHVTPDGTTPDAFAAAERKRLSQFEALDMLIGRAAPELGGQPGLVDAVGLNFYPHNQSIGDRGHIPLGHHAWRPLSAILAEYHARYGRPLFVAETGAEGCGRTAWLHYVCGEVEQAIAAGVPVEAICWYPITDYHGWDDGRTCPTGLFGLPDAHGRRAVHPPLAREFAAQRGRLARPRGADVATG